MYIKSLIRIKIHLQVVSNVFANLLYQAIITNYKSGSLFENPSNVSLYTQGCNETLLMRSVH